MIARIFIGGGFLALMLMTVSVGICIAEEKPRPNDTKETNHCDDRAAEAEWMALLSKNPKDCEVQALHSLRIGLCVKVDQGMLTVDEATKIDLREGEESAGGREGKRAGAGDAGVVGQRKKPCRGMGTAGDAPEPAEDDVRSEHIKAAEDPDASSRFTHGSHMEDGGMCWRVWT